MQMFLISLAQSIMGFVSSTRILKDATTTDKTNSMTYFDKVIQPVVDVIDSMLLPILIIIGTAGSIYAIVLGVNFAKAESADKREEAKKRMINAIIGLVVTIVLLILLKLFTANAGDIADWINRFSEEKPADDGNTTTNIGVLLNCIKMIRL